MKLHRFVPLLLALGFVSIFAARADEPLIIHLWEKGAPGFESRKDEPEVVKGGSVSNVHNPSITVFPAPKDKANGAAVIIVPGGGHRQLGFIGEGSEPAKFMNDLGITAFVLKHRLPREANSPYSLDIHPRQDIQRAMRLIRSRAAEWNLDPKRIGAMGFSAGGETVAMLVYSPSAGDPQAADPIDRMNCRCDFQISVYPGPLGIPAGPIPADAPPPSSSSLMTTKATSAPCSTRLPNTSKLSAPWNAIFTRRAATVSPWASVPSSPRSNRGRNASPTGWRIAGC
jgi:acetyl esterase/lipase